jgi:hypothetical protein
MRNILIIVSALKDGSWDKEKQYGGRMKGGDSKKSNLLHSASSTDSLLVRLSKTP